MLHVFFIGSLSVPLFNWKFFLHYTLLILRAQVTLHVALAMRAAVQNNWSSYAPQSIEIEMSQTAQQQLLHFILYSNRNTGHSITVFQRNRNQICVNLQHMKEPHQNNYSQFVGSFLTVLPFTSSITGGYFLFRCCTIIIITSGSEVALAE